MAEKKRVYFVVQVEGESDEQYTTLEKAISQGKDILCDMDGDDSGVVIILSGMEDAKDLILESVGRVPKKVAWSAS